MSADAHAVFTSNGFRFKVILVDDVRPYNGHDQHDPVPSIVTVPDCVVDGRVRHALLVAYEDDEADEVLLVHCDVRLLCVLCEVISLLFWFVRRPPGASAEVVMVLTCRLFRLLFAVFAREELVGGAFVDMSSQPRG